MTASADALLDHLYRLAAPAVLRSISDRDLLAAFVGHRHQGAFNTMVTRHGPMVLNVCRRVLGETHMAEDAYQATFLVLALKAGTVRRRRSLAAWLHGVAYRIALNARRAAKRRPDRRSLPNDAMLIDPRPDPLAELTARDLLTLLEDEVQRLPAACRLPVALCCLDGLSVKETASRLGLTEGAVKGHVERGRARLQARLVGRGLTLSAGLAVADATRGCLWAAPAKGLVASTVKAAVAFAEGQKGPLAGISPAVVHLARSALTGTIWLKVKVALVAVALVSMSVLGAGGLMPSEGASQADIPSAGPSRAEQPDGNVAKALNHQAAPQPPIAKKLPHVEAQLGHSPEVKALAFSPDRKQVLTGSADGTGQLWDMAARQDIRHFQWHTRAVQAVAYSPDGKLVLSSDGTLRLGNATTGKKIRNIGEPSTTTASAAVSPDGKQVLAGHLDFFSLRPEQSLDNKVLLWDVDSGKVVRSFVWKADTTWSILMTVAFSPDGKFVLTGGGEPTTGRAGLIENNMARLWDASTGKESRKFEGHKALIASLTFSADGKQVLTGSWDSTARLWDVATGKEVRKFEGQPARVTSVAISPDGKLVLTAPARGPARLWEVASGKEIRALVGQNQEPRSSPILSAVFTPDGKQVLTGSQDSTMRLWDCASGRELCSLLAFRDSTWAVLDSAGRYDSSNDGDSKWLYGVVGEATKTVPIMQLKERCYDPGLLAKHLGFNKKPLRGVDVTK